MIFASGTGSNAENLIRHFRKTKEAEVALLVANRSCGAVAKAVMLDVPVLILDHKAYFRDPKFISFLKKLGPDLLVLAGFLLLVPKEILNAFPGKVINIHPALLPKYGGKGMYGNHVHQAVIAAGEKESGITIHEVNEKFDEGKILFQAKCALEPGETPESLGGKIHVLEYRHFPEIVSSLLRK